MLSLPWGAFPIFSEACYLCSFTVVNCVQCHPFDCVVATSGIDNTIKVSLVMDLFEDRKDTWEKY